MVPDIYMELSQRARSYHYRPLNDIKLVTEALATVCGQETRDGLIRTQIQSRKKIPKFESKQQFFE